jgi:phosphoribosylglycinamide formyltransferase-1
MRILGEDFVNRWAGRMINIHPSLLPLYKGLDTHARAIADGATEHGCTVHYVTPGLDEGEAILQAKVPVLAGDTPETLSTRVLVEEHRIYPEALKILANRLP